MYINVILQWTNTTQGAFNGGEKYLYTSQPTHHLSPPKSIIYWLCWKQSSGVKTIPLAAPCPAARTMAATSLHWLCPTHAFPAI